MKVKNFFTELKRRNVYKVAIPYGVVDMAGSVAIPLTAVRAVRFCVG